MSNIIIGAGISGLTLGNLCQQKKINFKILEKEEEPGGLCRTVKVNDFLFDKTGHLLYFRSKREEDFIRKYLRIPLLKQERNSAIFYKNNFIPYPFQLNLWALPKVEKNKCISSIMSLSRDILKKGNNNKPPENFEDWARISFGDGIAEKFMLPYNKKLWRIPLKKLSLGWLGDFVPNPDYAQILMSADEPPEGSIGYNPHFYYPQNGGIQTITDALYSRIKRNVKLELNLESINPLKKTITVNGKQVKYSTLSSSIPLKNLMQLIPSLPDNIKNIVKDLHSISVLYLNIGFSGQCHHKYHWIYFPESKFNFYRIGFYNNISPSLVPKDSTSIYVEFSYREKLPFNLCNLLKKLLNLLKS
ncbi:MAG: NAD(P)-binding protein, partial [bacterium]|nr:NAD(P)-binding protein [bacterium]